MELGVPYFQTHPDTVNLQYSNQHIFPFWRVTLIKCIYIYIHTITYIYIWSTLLVLYLVRTIDMTCAIPSSVDGEGERERERLQLSKALTIARAWHNSQIWWCRLARSQVGWKKRQLCGEKDAEIKWKLVENGCSCQDWVKFCGEMGMDQYLLILVPFLVGWTSIYQLFWGSPGVQGFDTLPYGWCWPLPCWNPRLGPLGPVFQRSRGKVRPASRRRRGDIARGIPPLGFKIYPLDPIGKLT